MASALQIARLFIQLAASEEEPGDLTPLHVQKLLYYVQGWSLALRDRPMFPERLEAWKFGPVAPQVYSRFRKYHDHGIPAEKQPSPDGLAEEDRAFCVSIWEHYKAFSPWKLSDMTHEEPPWQDARGALDSADPGTPEISHDALRRFFQSEYERVALPGLDLASLRRSEEDARAGRFVGLEDLAGEHGIGHRWLKIGL